MRFHKTYTIINTRSLVIRRLQRSRTKRVGPKDGRGGKVAGVERLVPPGHGPGVRALVAQQGFEDVDVVAVPGQELGDHVDRVRHEVVHRHQVLVAARGPGAGERARGACVHEALDGADKGQLVGVGQRPPLYAGSRRGAVARRLDRGAIVSRVAVGSGCSVDDVVGRLGVGLVG